MSLSSPEPSPPLADLTLDRKPCPMCGGQVLPEAKVCRFCGEQLVDLTPGGMWREGELLVLRRSAVLPPRCLITNEETTTFVTRHFSWHPKWCYGLIPLTPLYVIVLPFVQRQATLRIGISRRQLLWERFLRGLIGLAVLAPLTLLLVRHNRSLVGPLVAFLLIALPLLLIAVKLISDRGLTAARITQTRIWLRGVHPEFLAQFPPWPGETEAT